jgi:Universal stress protein family
LLGRLEQEAVTAVCVYGYRRSTRMNIRTGEFAGTLSEAERTLTSLRDSSLGDGTTAWPVGGLSPAGGLHQLAEDEGADLLVLGSTTCGRAGRTFPWTTDDRLLNGAPCAVAVLPIEYRGQATDALRRLGVAYCRSAEATSALQPGP